MKYFAFNIILTLCVAVLFSCDSKPKVIESQEAQHEEHDHANSEDPHAHTDELKERKFVVAEVLNTSKYSYLKAEEAGVEEEYWVAIPRTEVEKGDVYFFKGGLLKKNFKSQEFDRVFETVYLVSNFWKNPGDSGGSALDEALSNISQGNKELVEVGNIEKAEGSVNISEVLSNKEKYNGKKVQVTGKCVKVNPMIMGRNWVHLKDNSSDKLDLTITTTENVALGQVVTMEGTVILDKDFGSGYRYDIIMEQAVIVQ